MKKLSYDIEIHASPEKVYDKMLGLSDKKTYEAWTAFFEPTSSWEGTWDEGGKIIFTSNASRDEKSGMVARIEKNDPAKFVSIHHYGMLEEGKEITEDPKMEGWGDALENYWFTPTSNGTKLKVEVDMKEEYVKQMEEVWPKALAKLKEICE
nr:SRPBCC domain-containing protein [uncultured Fluviicola sp.]